MLKAELAVLEGSNNEADIARAKKLRAEIAEAEDSLAEEKRAQEVRQRVLDYTGNLFIEFD